MSSQIVCSVFNVNDEEVLKLSAVISQSELYPALVTYNEKNEINDVACERPKRSLRDICFMHFLLRSNSDKIQFYENYISL